MVLTTSGTIVNPTEQDGYLDAHTQNYLSGEELIGAVPEVTEIADITVNEITRVWSSSVSFET